MYIGHVIILAAFAGKFICLFMTADQAAPASVPGSMQATMRLYVLVCM